MKKVSVKLNLKMNYPGDTTIKGSVRRGIHRETVSWTGSTEDLVNSSKELKDALRAMNGYLRTKEMATKLEDTAER